MIFCGLDLAVKKEDVLVKIIDVNLYHKIIKIFECKDLIKLVNEIMDCDVLAIDSPFSLSIGYRSVDKEMIKEGFRVFPPNFIKDLVKKNLNLLDLLKEKDFKGSIVETHPRSSEKASKIDKEMIMRVINHPLSRDEADAFLCALTAIAFKKRISKMFKAEDGEIHILSDQAFSLLNQFVNKKIIIERFRC